MTTLTTVSSFYNNCALETMITEATIVANVFIDSPVVATIVKKANFFNTAVAGMIALNLGYLCLGNAFQAKPIVINQVFFSGPMDHHLFNKDQMTKIANESCSKFSDSKLEIQNGFAVCYK